MLMHLFVSARKRRSVAPLSRQYSVGTLVELARVCSFVWGLTIACFRQADDCYLIVSFRPGW
jgi:hypothetical protein